MACGCNHNKNDDPALTVACVIGLVIAAVIFFGSVIGTGSNSEPMGHYLQGAAIAFVMAVVIGFVVSVCIMFIVFAARGEK